MSIQTFLIGLFFLIPTGAFSASGPGTGSADFLQIPVGARESALGGAFTAVADNADAVYYNPAGLGQLQNPEISFTHNSYVKDVSQQWFAVAYPYKSGTFGAGLNYLSVGAFDAYDAADNRTGSVSAYDMALYFSYGRRLPGDYKVFGSISYGASLKYIREGLDTKSAAGVGVDLGFLIEPHIKNLRFGLGVENVVSSRLKFIDEGFTPPLKLKTGVSYRVAPGSPVIETLLTVDFNLPNAGANYMAAGIESRFYKMLALRFGYSTFGDISNGCNFGLGFDLSRYVGKNIMVDYSFGSTYDLGDISKLGVSWKFGPVN